MEQGRKTMILEKYIDLTTPGADYDIKAHIANGWYIFDKGRTLIILRKNVPTPEGVKNCI